MTTGRINQVTFLSVNAQGLATIQTTTHIPGEDETIELDHQHKGCEEGKTRSQIC
jgi:hypothetical protein